MEPNENTVEKSRKEFRQLSLNNCEFGSMFANPKE